MEADRSRRAVDTPRTAQVQGGVVFSFPSMIRRVHDNSYSCTHIARARPHNGLHSPSYIYTTTSLSHAPRKLGGKEYLEVHKLTPQPVYDTLPPTLVCVHACMSVCVHPCSCPLAIRLPLLCSLAV